MDFTNFWFPKKAGAGGDPGDPIDQSLRVYDDRRIRKSNADWTTDFSASGVISIWYKFGMWFNDSQSDITWVAANIGVSGADRGMGHRGDTGAITVRGTTGTVTVPGLYRDPGAWYHIVMSCDGTHQRVWINGELKLTTTSIWAAGPAAFDSDTWAWTSPTYSPGAYMAAVYFIDGQALGPETFGRYNDYGVWVPVRPEGLTFGSNGFYLDFSDPDDLGADRSGNGNDFTAVGFNTQLPGVWSQQLFTSTKSAIDFTSTNTAFAGGAGPEFAFDGVDNFATNPAATSDTSLIFRPNVPLANVTEIRVNNGGPTGNAGNENGFNGANVTPVAADGGWMTLYSGPPITVNNIFTQSDNRCFIGGISINGQVLVDNTGEDYDLMADSPTQNHATLNPLPPRSSGIISDANLRADIGSLDQYIWGTQAMTSPCYWETQFVSGDPFECGLVDIRSTTRNSFLGGAGGDTYGYGTNGQITNNATSGAITYATWGVNDVIGQAYDPATGRWWASVNGVWQGGLAPNVGDPEGGTNSIVIPPNTDTNDQLPVDQREFMAPGFGPNGGTSVINFGQQPFIHPVPNGFNRLQTQNLPEATIRDGRDHFQAITGPGQGNDGATAGQLGGNWSQDCFNLPYAPDTTPDLASIPTLTSKDNFVGPAASGFDGSTAEDFLVNSGAAVFRPSTPIENVTQVVSEQFAIQRNALNGTDLGNTSQSASNEVIYDGPAVTLESWAAWSVNPGSANGGWWTIKVRINGGNLITLVDFSILAQAQALFPNGLWWVKSRVSDGNTNQHQLVDSIRGNDTALTCPTLSTDTPYIAPAGNSVAWCWSAPDTWASTDADITAGTIATSGRRNAAAGFSMFTYQGTLQPGETVAHGLRVGDTAATPEFIIIKNRGEAIQEWHVRHKDLGGNQWTVRLNMPTQVADFNSWNNTAPNENHIILGPVHGTNGNNQLMMAYTWASVPGYSAFGSYVGNNDPDGPFIYTGFRPAFVMVKRFTTTGSWIINDSTRDIANPGGLSLSADVPNPESGGDSFTWIDFLSNGFKWRTNQPVEITQALTSTPHLLRTPSKVQQQQDK